MASAKCKECDAVIKGQKRVTSNFIQHIRRRHSEAYDVYMAGAPPRKRLRISGIARATNDPTTSIPPEATTTPVVTATPPTVTLPPQALHTAPTETRTQPALADLVSSSDVHAIKMVPPMRTQAPASILSLLNRVVDTAIISLHQNEIVHTPLTPAIRLSNSLRHTISFKREDQQHSGSLHYRAAYTEVFSKESLDLVLTSGPAAIAVAHAAAVRNVKCTVIMPIHTLPAIVRSIHITKATILANGLNDATAAQYAYDMSVKKGGQYINPAGPILTRSSISAVKGYAMLALEIVQQRPSLKFVVLPNGNAAMVAAMSSVIKRFVPTAKVIVAVQEGSEVKGPVDDNEYAWNSFTDHIVRVSQDDVYKATSGVFEDSGVLVTELGALSVAGATKFVRNVNGVKLDVVAVVDSPQRSLDDLYAMISRMRRVDGSTCLLALRGKRSANGNDDINATSPQLTTLMEHLARASAGKVRVYKLRFSEKWPVLVGLLCSQIVSARVFVDYLMTAGYHVDNVTNCGIDEDDVQWETVTGSSDEKEDVDGHNDGNEEWAVFQLNVKKEPHCVWQVLHFKWKTATVRRASYRLGGNGVCSVVVALKESQEMIHAFELEMRRAGVSMHRVFGTVGGSHVLGVRLGEAHGVKVQSVAKRSIVQHKVGRPATKVEMEIAQSANVQVGDHQAGPSGVPFASPAPSPQAGAVANSALQQQEDKLSNETPTLCKVGTRNGKGEDGEEDKDEDGGEDADAKDEDADVDAEDVDADVDAEDENADEDAVIMK